MPLKTDSRRFLAFLRSLQRASNVTSEIRRHSLFRPTEIVKFHLLYNLPPPLVAILTSLSTHIQLAGGSRYLC